MVGVFLKVGINSFNSLTTEPMVDHLYTATTLSIYTMLLPMHRFGFLNQCLVSKNQLHINMAPYYWPENFANLMNN